MQNTGIGSRPPLLEHLTALLDPYLAGESPAAMAVDTGLVRFAQKRHGTAPLLRAAAQKAGIADAALEPLEAYTAALARRQAIEMLSLRVADARLTEAGIAWAVLKGGPQAQTLYGDTTLRPSSDIDVLVAPKDFLKSIAVLRELGWTPPDGLAQGTLRRMGAAMVRDVPLRQPNGLLLELHQRPLFSEPFHVTGAALLAAVGRDPLPAPQFGPELVHYIFCHGVLSYWARLKWLIDLTMAFTKLGAEGQTALIALSRQRHTQSSLAASLLLAAEHFPQITASWPAWTETQKTARPVQQRLQRYRRALASADPARESPLYNRYLTFEANYLLFESAGARCNLLLQGPLTALMRRLAGLSHN